VKLASFKNYFLKLCDSCKGDDEVAAGSVGVAVRSGEVKVV